MQCISKGKEHKEYEFCNKVSIIRSVTGIILEAMSFLNEYDGHTIESSLEQVERLTERKINVLAGDRRYIEKKEFNGTKIMIPDVPKKADSRYQKLKKHKLFCKRAGIEPTIAHLKSDYRLGRNFYKGVVGNTVNVLLEAAAYNFKKMRDSVSEQYLAKMGFLRNDYVLCGFLQSFQSYGKKLGDSLGREPKRRFSTVFFEGAWNNKIRLDH